MLRSSLTASALAALMLCTACDQNPSTKSAQDQQAAQEQQQAMRDTAPAPVPEPAPVPAPTDTTDTAQGPSTAVGNELDQATGAKATFTSEELAGAQKIGDVVDPGTTLANAAVKTKDGEAVGEVRSIVVGKDGKADQVVVEVGGFLNVGERAVALKANQFTYLPARKILITEVKKADLEKLPPAKTTP